MVMAFDPATDDPELLRTVVQLLRVAAIASSTRRDREDIHTADEKITEAIAMLGQLDEIRKTADTIRKGADKIGSRSTSVQTGLNRLLAEAQDALAGALTEPATAASSASPGEASPDDRGHSAA